jgi:inorganic pyrophosphatase
MDLDQIPARAKDGFHVVVEAPRGASIKFKFDPELQVIIANRPLPLGYVYPYDWGFVPSTRAADGDPLDALVYWDVPSYPGVVVECRALGVLELEQDARGGGRQRNDRLLAIPLAHPRGEDLRSIGDLPERVRAEIAHFFTSSVFFEPKNPSVLGWKGPPTANALLDRSAR